MKRSLYHSATQNYQIKGMSEIKDVLTYKGAVMTWECDSNQHMNVMYYVNKYENAGRNFNIELDLINTERNGKIGIVVVEQQIRYFKEAFEDDLISIKSSLLGVGNKSFTVLHKMYNTRSGDLLGTMKVVLVMFDKVNRKGLLLPKQRKGELLELLEMEQ